MKERPIHLLECQEGAEPAPNRTISKQNSERQYQATTVLLSALPTILVGIDEAGQVVHWNPAAENTFGIAHREAVGRQFSDCPIEWNWPMLLGRIEQCRQTEQSIRLEDFRFLRGDKDATLGISLTPIRFDDDSQPGCLLVGEDTTERKLLQMQLTQAQKLESIGQLAAGIAHEINTPTQYIGDNTRFLQDAFNDLSTLLKHYDSLIEAAAVEPGLESLSGKLQSAAQEADLEFLLDEIPRAIQQSLDGIERVSKIVLAMKEFSHPDAGEKVPTDLNRAVENTVMVARNEWKYVADLETQFDPAMPLVPCLSGEVNQVILNLVVNAAHAIAEANKSGENRGTIRVSTTQDGEWAEIRVQDTGTGIPPAARPRIFDPFFTTKDVGRGTGQGLAMARSIVVDKHQGDIHFETELGKGTTFFVRLPLYPQAEMLEEAA